MATKQYKKGDEEPFRANDEGIGLNAKWNETNTIRSINNANSARKYS